MPTIVCPIRHAALKHPETPALIAGRTILTYKIFDQRIASAVRALQELKIKKGDRIGLLTDPSYDAILLLAALWRIGATACILNTRLPAAAQKKQFQQLRCRIIFTDRPSDKIPGCRIFPLTTVSMERKGPPVSRGPHGHVSLDRSAVILMTSGTSAEPKAAVLNYGNLYYNALGSNENLPVRRGDRWLLSLPLCHVSGLGIIMRCALAGGTVVLPAQKDLAAEIRQNKITHLSLVATQFQRLAQTPSGLRSLRAVKAILLGGGPIPPEAHSVSRKNSLPVHISYGMTESASQIATSRKGGTRARVLKFRKVRTAPDGELLLKGPVVFKGYWKNGRVARPGRRGWFPTGDTGELRKDGTLTILGRKDTMFISGGENIRPEEIERYLLSIKGVERALVAPLDDPEFGRRPVAFVLGLATLSAKRLTEHLREHLPGYKIPVKYCRWPDIGQSGLKPGRKIFEDLLKTKKGLRELT